MKLAEAGQALERLEAAVPFQNTGIKLIVLMLALLGSCCILWFVIRLIFELTRPLRRHVVFMPFSGLTMSVRIDRRRWTREHDPTAQLYFRNEQHGSIIQISLNFIPPEAVTKKVALIEVVRRMRDMRSVNALEKDIQIKDLHGKAEGYYFQCTDKKVKPGEWAFITCGFLWQEDSLINFDLLSHNAHDIDSGEVLSFMRTLTVVRTSAPSANFHQMLESHRASSEAGATSDEFSSAGAVPEVKDDTLNQG